MEGYKKMYEAKSQRQEHYNQTTKRSIDVLLASIIIFLLSPVFFVISLSYLFEDKKGPIFFKQKRVGEQGKEFYIYKFRSMIMNAEEVLEKDQALYEEFVRNGYKLDPDKDPRITKTGQFLRKTSLDELPQLFNVVKGEMSLVGPRPIVAEELLLYKERREEFLSVRPGMTGLWQVSGRSDVSYPERVELELEYVERQSARLDLWILVRTAYTVMLKRGAY